MTISSAIQNYRLVHSDGAMTFHKLHRNKMTLSYVKEGEVGRNGYGVLGLVVVRGGVKNP